MISVRKMLLGLLVLLLAVSTAPAQVLNIHTEEGTTSFNLAEIDSITFGEVGEEIEPGEERDFELTDDVTITMCWIPAGEFEMGSPDDEDRRYENEGPVHTVTFEYGFWMGKYEVTQAQWEAVTGRNPSGNDGDNHPVENVSWNDIHEDFLTMVENGFRLPSEAEWEYACRAGTDTRYYWGDDPDYEDVEQYAVHWNIHPDSTAQVGTKRPNSWGLYDMSGNVWERCEDWDHANYNGAPRDGRAWVGGGSESRIMRGGSYSSQYYDSRSARRGIDEARRRSSDRGFRLVIGQ